MLAVDAEQRKAVLAVEAVHSPLREAVLAVHTELVLAFVVLAVGQNNKGKSQGGRALAVPKPQSRVLSGPEPPAE